MRRLVPVALVTLIAVLAPSAAGATSGGRHTHVNRLVTRLAGGSGSTIGPGRRPVRHRSRWPGRISRVDPGHREPSPRSPPACRRACRRRRRRHGHRVPRPDRVRPGDPGRTRRRRRRCRRHLPGGRPAVPSPSSPTSGAFAIGQPAGHRRSSSRPASSTRCETYRGGFLVTDGHHNRVLRRHAAAATVTEVVAFGNVVPTGLAARGNTVYMAEAGPVPHLPQDGKRHVSFAHPELARRARSPPGGRLLVDVEFGRGAHALRPRRRETFRPGDPEGAPALHRTPATLRAGTTATATFDRRRRPPRPADVARAHPRHRVRRHADRGDLDGADLIRPPWRPPAGGRRAGLGSPRPSARSAWRPTSRRSAGRT